MLLNFTFLDCYEPCNKQSLNKERGRKYAPSIKISRAQPSKIEVK
jgi:hypothetical protein